MRKTLSFWGLARALAVLAVFVFLPTLLGSGGAIGCGGSVNQLGSGDDDAAGEGSTGVHDATAEAASGTDASHPDATAADGGRADAALDAAEAGRDSAPDVADAARADGSTDARADGAEAGKAEAGLDATADVIGPDVVETGVVDTGVDATDDVVDTGVDAAEDVSEAGPDETGVVSATAPDPPTGVVAVAGDTFVTVSWTAPANNGGSTITGYTVTTTPGNIVTPAGGATSVMVPGLANGTTYTFSVTATNAVGTSVASGAVMATPAGAPLAPTGVLATPGNMSATVTWTAPDPNGSPITGYTVTVTSTLGTFTVPASGTTAPVTSLTNGTLYTFTVTATNAVGTGPALGQATATPAGMPSMPTILTAVPGDMSVSLTWTQPADNGSTITGYTVTSNPAGGTATTAGAASTSAPVPGLTNCTSYTFTVTATNGVGTSAASAPSSAVTPVPVATVSYATQIQANLFTTGYGCTNCHGASGGLAISYAHIVNVPAGQDPTISYVAPGDPGHSYLWCKVNPADIDCTNAGTAILAGTQRMPAGAAPMLAPDLALLKTWILECAQNN
jgi:fibronectin type III domain protein